MILYSYFNNVLINVNEFIFKCVFVLDKLIKLINIIFLFVVKGYYLRFVKDMIMIMC